VARPTRQARPGRASHPPPDHEASGQGKETTASHLRCHLRPYFGRRQLRQLTPSIVLRWQHELEGKLGHSGVMAYRSILLRILEAAAPSG
jgi:hypothetical protein